MAPAAGAVGRHRPRRQKQQPRPTIMLLLLVATVVAASASFAQAFVAPSGLPFPALHLQQRPCQASVASRRTAPLRMIGDFFAGFGNGEPKGIPRSIKDGINALRFATQRALRDRKSRMEVNLPRGVPLAVEGPNVDKDGSPSDKYEKSDRELARLVVELFKPIIDSTVVIFQQQRQARKAASIWGTELVKTTSFEEMSGGGGGGGSAGKKTKGKKKKGGSGGGGGGGFGAGSSGGGGDGGGGITMTIPAGTEVIIVVAPSPKELQAVRRLSDVLGMETLIIILNTPLVAAALYLPKEDASALLKEFEPVLFLNPLSDPSVKTLDNILLYRSYPGDWQIAQKGALGPPTILAQKRERFEKEEMLRALEKGAENNAKPLADKLMQGLFGGGNQWADV